MMTHRFPLSVTSETGRCHQWPFVCWLAGFTLFLATGSFVFADATHYRASVLSEPSLLSYYSFDGDAGTKVIDLVLPAQNGTVSGATFSTAVGTVGSQSIQGGRIGLGSVPAYEFSDSSGTIELFLYQTATAAYNPCFFSGRDDTRNPPTRYSLHGDTLGGRLYMWNGSVGPNVATPVNMINRLTHVAVVFDGGRVAFYFNGAWVGTLDGALGPALGRNFQIGASGSSNQESWPGRIDEVAIYGDALPAEAIAAHYASWIASGVGVPPVIVAQPKSLVVEAGAAASFAVEISESSGALYRWTRNGSGIAGATNATLTLEPVSLADQGAVLQCVVYNAFGGTHSTAATLEVHAPPSFLAQPDDSLRYIGQTATLSAIVVGSEPLSFQWSKDGALLPGATNSSLSFSNVSLEIAGRYLLRVDNAFGSAESRPVLLLVVPVVLDVPPQNVVRFPGQSASFTVSALGVPPLTFQWFHGTSILLNETNAVLNLVSLQPGDAGEYSVRVTSSNGSSNSPPAILTLLDPATPQTVVTPPPFEWVPQGDAYPADAVVLFNEIQYHPDVSSGGDSLQWIELLNVMRVDVDLSNWRLDGDAAYTFPPNTILPGGGYVVIAADPAAFSRKTGITTAFGPLTSPLPVGGGHLILRNHDGRMMDEMVFSVGQPWPEGPDGSGATLSKRQPLTASAEPLHWGTSLRMGGTPGAANVLAPTLGTLTINELDVATHQPYRLELFNSSSSTVVLEDYKLRLSSPSGVGDYALPSGNLQAGGFLVLDSRVTQFHPAPEDKLFLYASNGTAFVSAAAIKNQGRVRSPDGVGRWTRPSVESFGASNIVRLNRDVVINEMMYEAAPSYTADGYVGSSEEWVELFNRGVASIDLSGWSLDGAIHYSFPSNTVIQSQGYLVVARDAAAMRIQHPEIAVLGNYSGKLAKKTSHVELKDPDQHVVNEVRYFSSGRWPAYAAGGGSSLEVIDPYADNRRAESWAASDESGRSEWQTISYRGVAARNKGYDIGDNIWRECVIGLLDAGEFLLDDVSVIELPGTSQARQLIQDGNFDSDKLGTIPATWRAQGTHGSHGRTRVEKDPSNPANQVLHVFATGATDFLQNHLETTLKNKGVTVAVVLGREYEISFRVKWLAGARLLNSRLYAKWLQRTTVLSGPVAGGTPGRANSRRIASAGPTYTELNHSPMVPKAGTPVTVEVSSYDPQGIEAMTLFWRLDGASWSRTPMTLKHGGEGLERYVGTIPGQSANAKVQFYVEGRDPLGGVSTFPAEGAGSRAMVAFNDNQAAVAPNLNLRFVMTASDIALMYAMTNRMSNDRLGATVIFNESEVFYDVGVRLKGSAFGRDNDTEAGLSIDFDPDHKFRGAHDSISVERSSSKREILAMHLVNQAGKGVAAGYEDVAQVITPRVTDVGRGFLSMTRTTDTMLSTEYGAGGTVYNFELLYTPTTTVNGNPEAAKLNFPYEHTAGAPDLQDLGDDKEVYRWNFQLRNNRTRDDSSLMIAAAKSMELGGAALDAQARKVMDVDQWLRCFAIESLVGNDDFFTRLYNHNIRFYQRPSDNRLVAVPWDLDRAFGLAFNETLWGRVPDAFGGTNRIRKLFEYPPNLRAYYAHLQDLIATCYNANYATRWAEHFANLVGDSSIATYPSYIASRSAYVLSQIPNFPPFSITTSNGVDFTTTSNLVTLTGGAPAGLRYLSVNGELFDPRWLGVTNWALSLALPFGTSSLTVQGVDANGMVLSNLVRSINVTVSGAVEEAVTNVVINEIMYDPIVPGAEFVELMNLSSNTAYDLAGWRLNGAALTFDRATILPPGGFVVVAADRLAFASAYGASVPVHAEFSGRLDPEGETLSLFQPGKAAGSSFLVDRVRYESVAPWPASTAGGGRSLQLLDARQDNARVSNWADGSGWHYFTYTGAIGGSRLSIAFDGFGGDVFLDDLTLVTGNAPEAGANLLINSGFEGPLASTWTVSGIATNSHLTNSLVHSGVQSLHLIQRAGASSSTLFYQDLSTAPSAGTLCTLSGWFQAGNGTTTNLSVSVGASFVAKPGLRPMGATPGAPSLVVSAQPAYPNLWLNEVLPWNASGTRDGAGNLSPWVELYNAGNTPLALDDLFLSDDYGLLTRWEFPRGINLRAGAFLVVWCDGKESPANTTELHSSFALTQNTGSVVLSRRVEGAPQILDYLNYTRLPADRSYGSLPDGQPFYRDAMYRPTPGRPNDGTSAPLVVLINEWMAANTSSSGIADPADGHYDDWFELFNPGTTDADLGGYFLTDNLANKLQFQIPKNGQYVIPAGGYLLVWADGEPEQNATNRNDLHVNFSLKAAGEAIGLFAADGTQIDAVTFRDQLANVSQGRNPDGGEAIVSLPTPSPRGSNAGVVRPEFGISRLIGAGLLQLEVSTVPGRRYQLEYSEDLSPGSWSSLGNPILASRSSWSFKIAVSGVHGFFRISVLP